MSMSSWPSGPRDNPVLQPHGNEIPDLCLYRQLASLIPGRPHDAGLARRGRPLCLAGSLIPASVYSLLFAVLVAFTDKAPFPVHGLLLLTVFLAIMAILTWLAWWQKAYLALPFFLIMTTVITYLIVTFQVLVPFYQYRSAQSLTVLNDAAPVYFFEEYRTSYPYYTGQTAYWTAPADYDENDRLQRDAVWAKKHVYPTASEDQVLSSLNQHQNLTLVVPEGKYKDYKASEFFSLTRKVGRIGPYYIFKPSP